MPITNTGDFIVIFTLERIKTKAPHDIPATIELDVLLIRGEDAEIFDHPVPSITPHKGR